MTEESGLRRDGGQATLRSGVIVPDATRGLSMPQAKLS
ncbi:hypothetical protein LCGC14_1863040, partial [marine sediment metagenome]